MIIPDLLYNKIQLPDWLIPVIQSPEVQRLRDIRLINTSSVSCPSLSDVRRFTHSLGVLHLALSKEKDLLQKYSRNDFKTLLVATLLHDIGTPPFGHLFEYQLSSITGWDHEKMVKDICLGTYRLEKRYHQIYYSNALKLFSILDDISIDPLEVIKIILGESSLGKILAGSLDFDNIDNVYRMSSLLGLKPNIEEMMNYFDSISIDDGFIFNDRSIPFLSDWMTNRKKAYEVLAFDEWCLSGQAMLTDCFSISLRKGLLKEDHWFLTDEELLRQLIQFEDTKRIAQRFAIGDYYSTLFIGWYSIAKGDKDLRNPEIRESLTNELQEKTHIPCSLYVFYDTGSFSKELNVRYRDGHELSLLNLGENSRSTVISIFTLRKMSTTKKIKSNIIEVLENWGFSATRLKTIPQKEDIYGLSTQREIQY